MPSSAGWRSQSTLNYDHWLMDVIHILSGPGGWVCIVVIIDCHNQDAIGYEFTPSSLDKEAVWNTPSGKHTVLRSEWTHFKSTRCLKACQAYRQP